jgi:hypothetical protein
MTADLKSPRAAAGTRRGFWVWPYRAPNRVADGVFQICGRCADLVDDARLWPILAIAIGAIPAWLSYVARVPFAHIVSACAILPLLAGAAVRDSPARGMSLLLLMVLGQSSVNVTLSATDPGGLAAVLPAGLRYWEESRHWIVTGVNPEYDVNSWLPDHVRLWFGVPLLAYVSFGVAPLVRGLEQVDMMNYYVGRLIAGSESPWLAGLLGWHPWSVCRGIGCVILIYECVNFSLARLTGRPLSTGQRRAARWRTAFLFLALDCAIKYMWMEQVRSVLAANLSS